MRRQSLISSFKNALKGFGRALKTQRNLRLQCAAAILAVLLGRYLHITRFEWAMVFLCIGLVIGLELLNTALEELMDRLHPEWDEKIGRAKDMAAAAVFFASLMAALTGFAVFYARIVYLFN
jgi:diacylglycerol kinase